MPKFKLIDTDYTKIGIANSERIFTLTFEELARMTLDLNLGYHNSSQQWIPLITDADGRLLVSSSETQSDTVVQSVVNTSTTNALVAASLGTRKQIIIQNVGSGDVYIKLSTSDATTNDLLLESGATLIEDVYTGEINCIMSSGTSELRVAEYQ